MDRHRNRYVGNWTKYSMSFSFGKYNLKKFGFILPKEHCEQGANLFENFVQQFSVH